MSELPNGWAQMTIGDCQAQTSGVDPRKFPDELFDLYSVPSYTNYRPDSTLGRDIGSAKQEVREGDVLLCKIVPHIRRGWTVPAATGHRQIASGEWIVFRDHGLDAEYLRRFVLSDGFHEQFMQTIAGVGGSLTRARPAEAAKIKLPVPPLPEQRRIVAKIDSLTDKSRRARDHLDHIPRLVEKYKQAILAAAFRGDLTREWREQNRSACWSESESILLKAQRESYLSARRGSRLHIKHAVDAVPVPIGWFDAQLADVGRLQVGYAYKSKWYAPDGVRLLRGANIAPGRITWDDEARLPVKLAEGYLAYSLDAGDIVIAMDRPLISSGLKVARVAPEDAGCLLVQRVARYVPSELVEPDYAWHLINSQHFIEHAVTQATGSDLPHISSNDILTTPIPLPCRAEQREIAQRVTAALSWIDRLAVAYG